MQNNRRASTLIECLIYCSMLLLVLSLAYAMWLAGHRYMLTSRAQVEVQQCANTTTYSLNAELMEAAPYSVEIYPRGVNPDSTVVGVVFMSARQFNEPYTFVTEATHGFPVWQKVVGYYLDTDPAQPDNAAVRALYRVSMRPGGFTPTSNNVTPSSLGITTSTLKTAPAGNNLVREVVAHGVAAPNASLGAGTVSAHGGFNLYCQKVGSSAPDWSASPDYVNVSNPLYVVYRPLNNTSGRPSTTTGQPSINEVETDSIVRMRN